MCLSGKYRCWRLIVEKIIKEKISSLLSQEEEVLSVEQLGGMTNQNYLVKTTNKQYIVKFFGKGTEKLINRQDEKYNLELLKDLDLDVKNYLFDIEAGIKVNEYIESAITLDSTSIKTKFDKIAPILQTIHASGKELRGEFAPFEEIKKYESLIEEKIPYANYEAVREEVFSLEKRLADLGVDRKSCHIDLVPENFIESPQGRLYLIDWEYSSMNDPMWDLAALFLESEFTRQEEEAFLSHYESEQTPVSREKIAIYKILQDAIWSLWTVYKEEQGADFGDYGVSRYQRAVKGLASYGGSDEK
nr:MULTISPECIES: choline kinase LicA [unclassified Streptococcus]